MRIEQYIQMIDYALWEVIKNENTAPKSTVMEGVEKIISPTTAGEKAQKRFKGVQSTKGNQEYMETWKSSRRSVQVENNLLNVLAYVMVYGVYDWSDQAEEGPNYALMAYSSSSSDSEADPRQCCWVPKETVFSYQYNEEKMEDKFCYLEGTPKEGKSHQIDHKVKVIRCDNGTEFKNKEMNQFCEKKGILRQYSVARTPQQNGIAERRNRTLIKATRTMLADSKFPTTFWAEAVNTACYVQNRVLVVKPHNKTPYEVFHGRTPIISFMRPFGCSITILNIIDHLGKFDGKANECFFVRYSLNCKVFRVFNSRTRIVEENLHISFSESTPNAVGTQSNGFAGAKASDNADPKSSHDDGSKPSSNDGKKVDEDPRKESKCKDQEKEDNVNNTNNVNIVSSTVNAAGTNEINAVGGKISIELSFDPNMHVLEDDSIFDFLREDEDDGVVAYMNNLDTTIQAKTINGEVLLHALVDGKKIIITESTVRRDLQLEDAEGVDCLPNSTIFEQLTMMGSKTTAWNKFSKLGEGSANPTDPHHTPTIIQSSTQPQKIQKPRKPKRKETQVPQPSDPTESVADEAVHKELGDSLVRAATTASSLEAKQDSGGHGWYKTMGGIIVQTRVLDLEKTKTTQANEIASLKRRVKKLENKNRSRTHRLKRLYKVGLTARVESSGDEESLDDADKEMFEVDALNGGEVFVAGQNENVVEEVVDDAQVSTAVTTVIITTEEITLA
ncbi:retrovirus-related pol polyprotein from transposon TNT 1-94 [Tanacetum coccineum]